MRQIKKAIQPKLSGMELPAKRQILGSLCFFQLSHVVRGRILLNSILREVGGIVA